MTTANKIILTIILGSILAIGISHAHAEEFTANVRVYSANVTITLDHPVDLQECEKFFNEYQVFTQCLFLYNLNDNNPYHLSTETEDGCEEGYDRDITTDECKLPEVIEEEAWQECYDDPACPVGIYKDPTTGNTVNNQDEIEDEDKSPSQIIDEDYTEALKDLCAYDIALYQNGETFEVAFEEFLDPETGELRTQFKKFFDMKSIDLRNLDPDTRRLMLAVEACIGQTELKVREKIAWLTADTEHDQPHHSIVASGIPPYSAERLSEIENAKVEQQTFSIKNDICNGYYTDTYKKTFEECQTDYPVGNGTATAIENSITGEIKEQIDQYNLDQGEQMAKELTKENIEKKIADLRKQLNAQ